jgi:hypothetical protein
MMLSRVNLVINICPRVLVVTAVTPALAAGDIPTPLAATPEYTAW